MTLQCVSLKANASGQTMRPRWNLTLLPWSFGPSNPHHSISMFGRLRWQNAISNSHGATLITKKRTTEKHCNEKTLKNWIYKSIEFPWSKRPQHGAISTNLSSSKRANWYNNIMILPSMRPACSRCTWRFPFFDSNNCKHLNINCAQNTEVHPQICINIIRNLFQPLAKICPNHIKNSGFWLFFCISNHTAKLEPTGGNASHKGQITIKTRKCSSPTELCL